MKKVLFGLIILISSSLFSQDAMKITENTFKFLSSKKAVYFESEGSMNHDLDSFHITENFIYKVKIKDHQKINFTWNNGFKRKLINYNGQRLTFFSLDDAFFSKYDLKGGLDEMKKFVQDSLKYDFPLMSLFSKKGFQEIQKINPKAVILGLKSFKGHQVYHLVFQTEFFSWQMFISADKNFPVPYKVIVNDLKQKTQFSCEFNKWDFAEIPDSEFERSVGDFTEIK